MATMLSTSTLQPFAIQESVDFTADEVNQARAANDWVVLTRENGTKFAIQATTVTGINEQA